MALIAVTKDAELSDRTRDLSSHTYLLCRGLPLKVTEHHFSWLEVYDSWLKGFVKPETSLGGVLHDGEGDAGSLVEAYTLGDLQTFLSQFPAKHYTSGGREPLLYVIVLLLSLQFLSAIAFLAKDPSATEFRVDAPHLAIAAFHYKVGLSSPVRYRPPLPARVPTSVSPPPATALRGALW